MSWSVRPPTHNQFSTNYRINDEKTAFQGFSKTNTQFTNYNPNTNTNSYNPPNYKFNSTPFNNSFTSNTHNNNNNRVTYNTNTNNGGPLRIMQYSNDFGSFGKSGIGEPSVGSGLQIPKSIFSQTSTDSKRQFNYDGGNSLNSLNNLNSSWPNPSNFSTHVPFTIPTLQQSNINQFNSSTQPDAWKLNNTSNNVFRNNLNKGFGNGSFNSSDSTSFGNNGFNNNINSGMFKDNNSSYLRNVPDNTISFGNNFNENVPNSQFGVNQAHSILPFQSQVSNITTNGNTNPFHNSFVLPPQSTPSLPAINQSSPFFPPSSSNLFINNNNNINDNKLNNDTNQVFNQYTPFMLPQQQAQQYQQPQTTQFVPTIQQFITTDFKSTSIPTFNNSNPLNIDLSFSHIPPIAPIIPVITVPNPSHDLSILPAPVIPFGISTLLSDSELKINSSYLSSPSFKKSIKEEEKKVESFHSSINIPRARFHIYGSVGAVNTHVQKMLHLSQLQRQQNDQTNLASRYNPRQLIGHELPPTISLCKPKNKNKREEDEKNEKEQNEKKPAYYSDKMELCLDEHKKLSIHDLIAQSNIYTSILAVDEINLNDLSERMNSINNKDRSGPPILTKIGYYTDPPIEVLNQMTDEELSEVIDFVVGHVSYGYICWINKCDLRGMNLNLTVEFGNRFCTLYPNHKSDSIPPHGTGLNHPAHITLFRCWPQKQNKSEQSIKLYEALLHKTAESMNVKFISYNPSDGHWTFAIFGT